MRSPGTISLSFFLLLVTPVSGQQIVDLEALPCSEWLTLNPETKVYTSLWLDGYANLVSQQMRLDFRKVREWVTKLDTQCQAAPTVSVPAAFRAAAHIAQFGCDAVPENVCRFAIYPNATAAPRVRFTLSGAQRKIVDQVQFGSDVYCVCVNGSPPASYNSCPTPSCKKSEVGQDYNN
jgi:HdeA/HdeB family